MLWTLNYVGVTAQMALLDLKSKQQLTLTVNQTSFSDLVTFTTV